MGFLHLGITLLILAVILFLYERSSAERPAWQKWLWHLLIAAGLALAAWQTSRCLMYAQWDCHKNCEYHSGVHLKHGYASFSNCNGGGHHKRCKADFKKNCRFHHSTEPDCNHDQNSEEFGHDGEAWEEEIEIDSSSGGKKVIKKKIIRHGNTGKESGSSAKVDQSPY